MLRSKDQLDSPKLRFGLSAAPDGDPRCVYLFDQLRIVHEAVRLTQMEFAWVRLFNGRRSLRDVQAEAMRHAGGLIIPLNLIVSLVQRLDQALFLDNARFHEYLHGPDREPSCIGCYPAAPSEIRKKLRELFTADGGPGLPDEPGCRIEQDGRVRAVLVPHIDYGRGNVTFGWGFKELIERTDASLFIIIGTSHYSCERFTLTRKNFRTPLGVVPTDQQYIDRLVKEYGDGLFNDPIAHLPEHSIELEVLLLQYLLEGKRPFRIVPLVVGSFGDCVEEGANPGDCADIQQMVTALRQVERDTNEPICYVISGDLAHIGPKFDDPDPVDEPLLGHSLRQDHAILRQAEGASVDGYYRVIAAEGDCRRICGLPPTWLTLSAVSPTGGKLLHYGRYVHPEGFESVSFASMAFE